MNDQQLLRYSRHVLLDEIGIEGQQRLLDSHALVIGAGGLGSPALLYLASAGVGRVTIVDNDTVDLTNLQRQVIHDQSRVGMGKALSAARSMQALNSGVKVQVVEQRADADLLDRLVPQADVVIDCTDNYATRHAINRACVTHGKPLVSGAAISFDGQVGVFDSRSGSAGVDAAGPCYACMFPPDAVVDEVRCATMGVFAPLVGIVGAMQAAEALKLLSGVGRSLAGRLQMLDARTMEWTQLRVERDAGCPVCAAAAKTHSPPQHADEPLGLASLERS
ncbi:MAG: molybdopterin biosynthesis protein MoeB [Rhizobacter sp.]|nr:molybdopterin biosynthesis protein MoeB [Rhizobacter sp.]